MDFNLVNLILIHAIKLWKQFKEANPNQPSLTDAQVIAALGEDSAAGLAEAEAWLAAHPKQTPA